MQRNHMEERLKRLEEKKDEMHAQIKRIIFYHERKKRKQEVRRKILIGSCILSQIEQGKLSKKTLLSMLDEYLENSYERSLFDLP